MKASIWLLALMPLMSAVPNSVVIKPTTQLKLRGTVTHDVSGAPVENAYVSISGGDITTTNSLGVFELDLPPNTYSGQDFDIIIYAPGKYGYHKRSYRANAKQIQTADFSISQNADLGVVGIVKDKRTGRFVKEVLITVSSNSLAGYALPSILTNEFGYFGIGIPKARLTKSIDYAEILIRDPSRHYNDYSVVKNINAPVEILLDAPPVILKYDVGSKKQISLDVVKGDKVAIKASGTMKVGNLIGHSDPNGVSGLFNFNLEAYNIVPNFKHACLMYALPGDTEWRFCGTDAQFDAPMTGKLDIIFEINDNQQGDNSGAYNLEITVEGK